MSGLNGRAIKKRMMKGRSRYLFGRRAFLSVYVPFSVYPEPPPRVTIPGENVSASEWSRRENGKEYVIHLHSVFSGGDPREDNTDPEWRRPLAVRDDGGGFSWWEVFEVVYDVDESEPSGIAEDSCVFNVIPDEKALEYIEQVSNLEAWIEKYIYGIRYDPCNKALLGLIQAANAAKATYPSVCHNENTVVLEFAVKWFYPEEKFRVCSSLRRASRFAKLGGSKIRFPRAT